MRPLCRGRGGRASFTKRSPFKGDNDGPNVWFGWIDEALVVAAIAIAMFIALFGWGSSYFGWSDPSGEVQLALATAFILGIAASYKSKG